MNKKIFKIIMFCSLMIFLASTIKIKAYNNTYGDWLEDSELVYTDWDNEFLNYNCYAFAIDKYNTNIGHYDAINKFDPGIFCGKNLNMSTVDDLADIVVDDLEALGYTIEYYGTIMPSINFFNERLICMRMGDKNTGGSDYHFMKYNNNDNQWYHKPADTAILRYKYDPFEKVWTNEHFGYEDIIYPPISSNATMEYDSEIYYVKYSIPILELNSNLVNNYESTNLLEGDDKTYILNIHTSGIYTFDFSITTDIKVSIYDRNLNIISYIENEKNISTSYSKLIIYLEEGKKYFQIYFSSPDDSGSIDLNYHMHTYLDSEEIIIGNSFEFSDVHYVNSNDNLETYLNFYYNDDPSFYKLHLEDNSGLDIYNDTIVTMYDTDGTTILKKYNISGYSENAYLNGNNEFLFYLSEHGRYYIKIEYPKTYLGQFDVFPYEVTISDFIASDSFINLKTDILQEYNSEIINISSCNDYVKRIQLDLYSKFNVSLSLNNDNQLNNIDEEVIIIMFKEEYNDITHTYDSSLCFYCIMGTNNNSSTYEVNLSDGVYYLGYFGKKSNIEFSVDFTRIIDSNNYQTSAMIPDPEEGYPSGTEVLFNYGEYEDNVITKGFTRNIYFNTALNLPSYSRWDYEWYSEYEYYATVSEHGTVFAKDIDYGNMYITIFAIYKYNSSIIYYYDFLITSDSDFTYRNINSSMSFNINTENSTYKLELNESNCPYPWIQYYVWSIESNTAGITIDNWGFITATTTGSAVIKGQYSINSKIHLTIYLTVYQN